MKRIFLVSIIITALFLNNKVYAEDIKDISVNKIYINNEDVTDKYVNEVETQLKQFGKQSLRDLFKDSNSVVIEYRDTEIIESMQSRDYAFKTAKNIVYHREKSYGPQIKELEWDNTIIGSYTVDTKNQKVISAKNPTMKIDLYSGNMSYTLPYENLNYIISSDGKSVTFYATYELSVTNTYKFLNLRYDFFRITDTASGGIYH